MLFCIISYYLCYYLYDVFGKFSFLPLKIPIFFIIKIKKIKNKKNGH
jgi:hypothetical protein